MKQQNGLMVKPDIEKVRERFEEWRKTRKRGSKIPEDLWAAAVNLANTHSLTEICQWLGVEYNHLKKRIEHHQTVTPSSNTGFVELNLSQMMPGSECVIEVERSDGARMRMSVKGAVDAGLVEAAKTFWSRP